MPNTEAGSGTFFGGSSSGGFAGGSGSGNIVSTGGTGSVGTGGVASSGKSGTGSRGGGWRCACPGNAASALENKNSKVVKPSKRILFILDTPSIKNC